jgi:citrate synthase
MPINEHTHAPTVRSVLFHLTLFGEFCEDAEADDFSAALACECLRDAVEDLCRSLSNAVMDSHDQAAILIALHQSDAAFREDMPDLYGKTGAAKAFSALIDLVTSATASDRCFDRERRSTALGATQRFGKTLGAFIGSLKLKSTHRRPNLDKPLRLAS